jgi:hypothetical protein
VNQPICESFSLRLPYGIKEIPEDLAGVINAWHELPEAVRAVVGTIVQAASKGGGG